MTLRRLAPALLALGLAACGFHLRGAYQVPDFLRHVTLRTPPGSTLVPDLRLAMETVGMDPTGGEFTVSIEKDKPITQTTALVTRTEVSEVTLVYDVQYRLRYPDNRPATEVRHLLLRRSYQNDPTSLVGKTVEADTLNSELRSDAAQQIVRQLCALRPDQLLPDTDTASVAAPADPASS